VLLLVMAYGVLVTQASARAAADARVVGTFSMRAKVTTAVDVLDEYPGEMLTRRWSIRERDCVGNVCRVLKLDRERGEELHSRVLLRRVGPGRYSGHGVFYSALSCRDKVYPRGARVPYEITLTIAGTRKVDGVRFARRIRATYLNASRRDSTPCPLGPSHDSARYTGNDTSPLPTPARASFTSKVLLATQSVSFTDTSIASRSGGRIVSRLWTFGDPGSGAANTSTHARPTHVYVAPGSYLVTLAVSNADGLTSMSKQTVLVPGPPSAGFTYTVSGANVIFADHSSPGFGGSPITAWAWNFGDPSSGAQNTTTLENPTHTFSGPGTYTVTLTVTDGNGRMQTTAEAVVIAPPAGTPPPSASLTITPTVSPAADGAAQSASSIVASTERSLLASCGGERWSGCMTA
jgi:PKD repeat protein